MTKIYDEIFGKFKNLVYISTMNELPENDRKLISKALKTDYIDWMTIIPMVEEAETIHAKKKLSDILKAMYHREEFFANNL